MKDIFVFGLLDWQRKELESIEHADQYRFHSLLDFEEVAESHMSFDKLLERARRQLRDFGGQPAAIICHWDFPSSCLAPILAKEYGLPAPSLEAVLKCEHKYWARLEQQKVVPECIPQFQALDTFDPKAADKFELDFPVWVKPIKGFASQLGFYVEDREQLANALEEMREQICELGGPFNECLKHADLPPEIQGIDGSYALAESIIGGNEHAPEGYVQNHEVHVHGVFDMTLKQGGKAISHLEYPSKLPQSVQDRMADACRKVLTQVGFNNGCFNVEFFWDEPNDKLWIIEVNTRMSQSHSDLFLKVDGMSNHEVAISLALGEEPHLPDRRGRFETAAKFWIRKVGDAEVTHAPSADEVAALSKELGDALIEVGAEEGDRLSDLPNQPEYAYNVAEAYIGGESEDELMDKYHYLVDRLSFEFSDRGRLSH